jgi:hypothetical protein
VTTSLGQAAAPAATVVSVEAAHEADGSSARALRICALSALVAAVVTSVTTGALHGAVAGKAFEVPATLWAAALVMLAGYVWAYRTRSNHQRSVWVAWLVMGVVVPLVVHWSVLAPGYGWQYYTLRVFVWLPALTCVGAVLLSSDPKTWSRAAFVVLALLLYATSAVASTWVSLTTGADLDAASLRAILAAVVSAGLTALAGWTALSLVDGFQTPLVSTSGVVTTPDGLAEERRAFDEKRDARRISRSAPKVGLALSGGGIRAATFSLGFLKALDGQKLLSRVDYLSTVSGGGWAAGALALALDGSPVAPDQLLADTGSEKSWSALVGQFRRNTDYAVPGGLRFSAETLHALRHLLTGIFFQAVQWIALVAALILLGAYLLGGGDEGGALREAIDTVNAVSSVGKGDGRGFAGVLVALIALASVTAALSLLGSFVYRSALRVFVSSFVLFVAAVVVLLIVQNDPRGLIALAWFLALSSLAGFVGRIAGGRVNVGLAIFAMLATAVAVVLSVSPATAALLSWPRSALIALVELPLDVASALGLLLAPGDVGEKQGIVILFVAMCLLMLASSHVGHPNRFGLHPYWKERIKHAFLRSSDATLSAFAGNSGPIPILGAAVNTPRRDDGNPTSRACARPTIPFEFSPYYVGGPSVGWVEARRYPELTYAAAAAISAAAVNSQAGDAISSRWRAALGLLNLRLGYWLPNPRIGGQDPRCNRAYGIRFWLAYSARELLGLNSAKDAQLLVSDGGHHENLGLLPLVLRNCDVIVVVDAAADPHWTFSDLARATRLIRVEHGLELEGLDVLPLAPLGRTLQERSVPSPVAVGRIRGETRATVLVYVKATLTAGVPVDVLEYASRNPRFPQQPTSDQFFDEAQFEAYRKLGEIAAAHAAPYISTAMGRGKPS